MSESTGLTGLIVALINRRRISNTLRRIENENIVEQGVVKYQPSSIEAFFDETEAMGSMVFSGGLNPIRCRAISRAIECAYLQGYSVVAVHADNQELENTLLNSFGNQYVSIVNKGNPVYDPFYGKSNSDINRLVLSSGTKGIEVGSSGLYYLEGISDFIRSKGIVPYIDMYITCPHMELFDKINDLELKGVIDSEKARQITSKLMQGEIERSNIENFFSRLSTQSNGIIAKKPQLKYAVNVEKAFRGKQIISIDVCSSTNTILLNIVINEIVMEMEKGKRVLLIADNIPLQTSNALQQLVKSLGANCSVILSADDVYSLFGGEENEFFAFAGKCSKTILSKHSSAFSSQKLSEFIGYYDKKEITGTFSENANYVGQWGMGASSTASVTVKREPIIKPEELNRMSADEVFIQNKHTGEISFTTIV